MPSSESPSAPSLLLPAVSLPVPDEDGIDGAPAGPESPGNDDELPGGRRFDAEPPDGGGIDGIDAVDPESPGNEGIDEPLGPDEPGIEGPPGDGDDEGEGIDGPPEEEEDEGDELGIDGMPPLLELCCCVDSQPARINASAEAPSQWITRVCRPEECCVFMMASVRGMGGVEIDTHARIARIGRLSSDFGRNRSTPARGCYVMCRIISFNSGVQPEWKLKGARIACQNYLRSKPPAAASCRTWKASA
ncbi:MAG TPA: hypothetical protein VGE69_05650 [Pseudomonadales bacterium]